MKNKDKRIEKIKEDIFFVNQSIVYLKEDQFDMKELIKEKIAELEKNLKQKKKAKKINIVLRNPKQEISDTKCSILKTRQIN